MQGQGLYKRHKVMRGSDINAPTLEEMKKLSFDELLAVGERLSAIVREEAEKYLQRCRKSCEEMSRRENRVLYAGVQASCAT